MDDVSLRTAVRDRIEKLKKLRRAQYCVRNSASFYQLLFDSIAGVDKA
jgi:hypothetical protein